MRWPWRRRRGGRVVFIGTSPFDVAQVIASFPTPSPVVSAWIPDEPAALEAPEVPEPAYEQLAALAEVSALAEAYEPPAPPPPAEPPRPSAAAETATETPYEPDEPSEPVAAAPQPRPAPEERLGVQLGFADGTVMTLDDDDPRAVALRAAAARLTGTG